MDRAEYYSTSRPLDNLGRVVIPKEIRKALGWQETDNISIGVKDGAVYMKKFSNICRLCQNPHDDVNELNICKECISKVVTCAHVSS